MSGMKTDRRKRPLPVKWNKSDQRFCYIAVFHHSKRQREDVPESSGKKLKEETCSLWLDKRWESLKDTSKTCLIPFRIENKKHIENNMLEQQKSFDCLLVWEFYVAWQTV